MNNMPYLFIPDMSAMNSMSFYNSPNNSNIIMDLAEQVNRLNRDVRRLERRLNQLEKKSQPHIKKANIDDNDDSGMYMM